MGREREREMFYLTTHSTHFIYGYMASDIWLRTILIVRKETRCRHIDYSYRLTARFFYMHHPTDRITHTTTFVTPVVEHWPEREIAQWVHPMKDRSDDPPHHERIVGCCHSVSAFCWPIWRLPGLPVPYQEGARCSSVVRAFAHGAMGRRIDPSWGGPIELFLVPASAPRLV